MARYQLMVQAWTTTATNIRQLPAVPFHLMHHLWKGLLFPCSWATERGHRGKKKRLNWRLNICTFPVYCVPVAFSITPLHHFNISEQINNKKHTSWLVKGSNKTTGRWLYLPLPKLTKLAVNTLVCGLWSYCYPLVKLNGVNQEGTSLN